MHITMLEASLYHLVTICILISAVITVLKYKIFEDGYELWLLPLAGVYLFLTNILYPGLAYDFAEHVNTEYNLNTSISSLKKDTDFCIAVASTEEGPKYVFFEQTDNGEQISYFNVDTIAVRKTNELQPGIYYNEKYEYKKCLFTFEEFSSSPMLVIPDNAVILRIDEIDKFL